MQKGYLLKVFFVISLALAAVITCLYTGQKNRLALGLIKRQHQLIDSVRNSVVDSINQVLSKQVEKESNSQLIFQSKPIELYNLVSLFIPDQKLDYNLYDWKTGANNKSIKWLTHGIEMDSTSFYREGEAIVSICSKVIQCLDKKTYPCKWGIVLSGVRNGYTSFEISSVQSQELEKMEITELFKGRKFEAKLLKTDEFDNKTYRVKFPQKKPIDMSVQWSCGSAGCSLTIKCETLD